MPLITDSKKAFAEFKFWKNIIVPINKTESVILYPGEDCVNMLFSRDTLPFIFYGKIKSDEISKGLTSNSEVTPGFQVVIQILKADKKCIKASLKDLKTISGVLKKNVKEVEISDSKIVYRFLEKESGEDQEIFFDFIDMDDIPEINRFKELRNSINSKSYKIGDFCDDDILKIYLDGDMITSSRTHDKLFEYPTARLFSLINKDDFSIEFSEKINEKRLVDLFSTKEFLELHQLFLTI